MTEIPEHLLARSKERRAALGLEGGAAPAADAAAPSTSVEPAASASPAPAAATPAPATAPSRVPAPAPPPPPKPPRPEVAAYEARKRIPWWAMPVLAGLPVWAGVYAFTLEPPSQGSGALTEGEVLYQGKCASCHGASGAGQGDTFPALADGSVIETFPDFNDHLAWVRGGAAAANADGSYGNPDRPGGQHNTNAFGGVMPGFEGSLSEEDIALVVRYEREELGGAECEPELATATDEECE